VAFLTEDKIEVIRSSHKIHGLCEELIAGTLFTPTPWSWL
jgi:hypothetical protein